MIACTDVHFSYDGEHNALDGVSLSVADGEFVSVLGGNGSGKSTLARHLDALLVPSSGTVTVDGLDTAERRNVYDIRSRVGLVFQNPDDQIVAGTVEDDVAFGPENLGVPTDELRARVNEALSLVGLSGFERRETSSLSGGQKQRLPAPGGGAGRREAATRSTSSSSPRRRPLAGARPRTSWAPRCSSPRTPRTSSTATSSTLTAASSPTSASSRKP